MPYLGQTFDVTAAMFVPVDSEGNPVTCALPTHTYMHGTIFLREAGPSYAGFEGELGYLMAAGGTVTLMPDYLGLGGSEDVLHPYGTSRGALIASKVEDASLDTTDG